RPPRASLFPYTTLFRSTNSTDLDAALTLPNPGGIGSLSANSSLIVDGIRPIATIINVDRTIIAAGQTAGVMVVFSEVVEQLDARSEEHTSELQSRENLV